MFEVSGAVRERVAGGARLPQMQGVKRLAGSWCRIFAVTPPKVHSEHYPDVEVLYLLLIGPTPHHRRDQAIEQ